MNSSQRTDTINLEYYKRNIPSSPLQPYLNTYPTNTKYQLFPTINKRKLHHNIPINEHPNYNIHHHFNPSNTKPPFCGFANDINIESELRGQLYAIQKGSKHIYVPNSNSDLYSYRFVTNDIQKQPFEYLFHNEYPNNTKIENNENIGYMLFNNHTRNQLKSIPL